ncbi:expressed unknown protein [Seminavis robusta]|uniref:Ankyrin repeat protein n=1 Tax=Seminavis robusta TaxID=568900 RepID=A0A9N8H5H0_9STRA|nr:expressed unknown protein [Seminavis robusta]|eukprot:Sro23_g016120.1 n/a (369) ;mRNA; r:159448-160676
MRDRSSWGDFGWRGMLSGLSHAGVESEAPEGRSLPRTVVKIGSTLTSPQRSNSQRRAECFATSTVQSYPSFPVSEQHKTEVTMASVAGEPSAKRKRVDDVADGSNGGMEDDATAKRKLAEAGFDPNDCITAIDLPSSRGPSETTYWLDSITPMIYFSHHGDLAMCRYILKQGGITGATRAGPELWFPMKAAVVNGNLAVAQWLYKNGAKEDIFEEKNSPFISAWNFCWNERKARDGEWKDYRPEILSWSQDVLRTHNSFQMFLKGTLHPEFSMKALHANLVAKLGSKKAADVLMESIGTDKGNILWTKLLTESPAQQLRGNSGVLKSIAEFVGGVGVYSAKEMENHRKLVELLPQSLIEFPSGNQDVD